MADSTRTSGRDTRFWPRDVSDLRNAADTIEGDYRTGKPGREDQQAYVDRLRELADRIEARSTSSSAGPGLSEEEASKLLDAYRDACYDVELCSQCGGPREIYDDQDNARAALLRALVRPSPDTPTR